MRARHPKSSRRRGPCRGWCPVCHVEMFCLWLLQTKNGVLLRRYGLLRMCKNIELIATCRWVTTRSGCQTRINYLLASSAGWGASVRGEQQAMRAQIWRLTEAQSTDLLCGTNPSQRTVRCWYMVACCADPHAQRNPSIRSRK